MKYLKKYYDIYVYAIFAVFYFWLAAQIPYTHDDWDWGLPIGIQQLTTANINGRYAGNFLEVIMTRSELLKTIIIGSGYFLLPFIISGIVFHKAENRSKNERLMGFVLCNVLLLSMHSSIWRQTYGWIAGYANFGLSSIFLLLVLREFLRVFNDTALEANCSYPRAVALFVVCLLGQLFIENVSIYVFLVALSLNWVHFRKTKRFSRGYISMFLASLIGLLLVFSSSIYNTLWLTGEAVGGYRQLVINAETDIRTVLVNCLHQIVRMPYNIYAKNFSVCMTIIVLMSILVYQKNTSTPTQNIVFYLGNILVAVCLLLSYFLGTIVGSVSSILFFVVVTTELIQIFKNEKSLLYKLLFVWISPVCIILPLVFTSELGERLFFTSNAVLILFAIYLFRFCLKSMTKKVHLAAITGVLAGILLIYYGTVYYAIGKCNKQRNEIIKNAVTAEADTIILPQYPYPEYLWGPDPTSPNREAFFKDFYDIPQNVSIVIED